MYIPMLIKNLNFNSQVFFSKIKRAGHSGMQRDIQSVELLTAFGEESRVRQKESLLFTVNLWS